MMEYIDSLKHLEAFSMIMPSMIIMFGFCIELNEYFNNRNKDGFEHPRLVKHLWTKSCITTFGRMVLTIPSLILDFLAGLLFLGMWLTKFIKIPYIVIRHLYIAIITYIKDAIVSFEKERHID